MKSVDLFSGIGGFALGLDRAGIETVLFCEKDAFCRKIIRKHWPETEIYDDIAEVTAKRLEASGISGIDIITGGFPCQPFSTASAGNRYGDRHDGYLWPEMRRVIEELRPRYVIAENVVGIISMALDTVVSDLERIGYSVWTFVIPACAVGHDHRRDRVWILAHADSGSKSSSAINAETQMLQRFRGKSERVGGDDGLPAGMDRPRLRALGNSVTPRIPEIIGRAILESSNARS